mgnify:CR=1 FL=1
MKYKSKSNNKLEEKSLDSINESFDSLSCLQMRYDSDMESEEEERMTLLMDKQRILDDISFLSCSSLQKSQSISYKLQVDQERILKISDNVTLLVR